MKRLDALFSPIQIGNFRVKNRIVYPATGSGYVTEEGHVTDKVIGYYEDRAKGGAGIVITEGTTPDYLNRANRKVIGAWDDRFISGLQAIAKAIKSHGALAVVQLNHAGPKALYWSESDFYRPVSASSIPVGTESRIPESISKTEIKATVKRFVDAAVRVKRAGWDGVELHCAHFYLLSSFLSPHLNKRKDEYGGNVSNRCRIIIEIIKGIQKRVGESFLLSCRINGYEPFEDGLRTEEAREIAKELEDAGANLIDVSSIVESIDKRIGYRSCPPRGVEKGCFVKYAKEIKSGVGVPVIGVGNIMDPVFADRIIKEGQVDLVAMSRALIADPDLPNKAFEGRIEEIHKCTQCMACITKIEAVGGLSCPVNPKMR